MKEFIRNETGAVTVDWVVMTASLVGLGLAVSTVISGGLQDQSADINSVLTEDSRIRTSFASVVAVIVPLTQGFTVDQEVAPGEDIRLADDVDDISFKMEATLGADTDGILWEVGGSGRGTILYQHEGMLYLQSGKGDNYGEKTGRNGRGEAAWAIETGTRVIEGSVNANGGLALYVDGQLVDESRFTAASVAGGNVGGVGQGRKSVATNRGGFDKNTPKHTGAGTLELYVGELTEDVK